MRVKDLVKAGKAEIQWGGWKADRMAKSVFPLGKSGKKTLKLAGYDYCCVRFKALGCEFRLLIAVHFDKREYYAHLGKVCGPDTQMLSSLEYHSSHPGWHVHPACGDTTFVPVGRYTGEWRKRLGGRGKDWDVPDLDAALAKACRKFGVSVPPPPAGGQQLNLLPPP